MKITKEAQNFFVIVGDDRVRHYDLQRAKLWVIDNGPAYFVGHLLNEIEIMNVGDVLEVDQRTAPAVGKSK